jgi:uncharacterized protein (DUF362 family)/Pyruvate/2-oxoacid:ferredoxin oxidoreductase delta subunit
MPSVVSIKGCSDYREAKVEECIRTLINLLGGIERYVRAGETVLIKPNLLATKRKEEAVNTDPAVVRAVLKLVLEAGAKAIIGDSPGVGSAPKNAARCGISEVAEEFGIPILDFQESVAVGKIRQGGFPLEVAGEALTADAIVNLPKLKTHGQMLMTLGVKNLFGCVVGKRKIQWHLKAGVNREAFARMLVELYTCLSPTLTVIDGILGMEGNGPGSGTPRQFGILAASADTVALDAVVMELMGLKPAGLATLRVAREMGVGETSLKNIRIVGDGIETLRVHDLKVPESSELEWVIPDFLVGLLKNSLSAYPESDPKLCDLCRICVKACPQQVISVEKKRIRIDTRHCIRCFCCQELCPKGAIKTRQGWLLRLMKK